MLGAFLKHFTTKKQKQEHFGSILRFKKIAFYGKGPDPGSQADQIRSGILKNLARQKIEQLERVGVYVSSILRAFYGGFEHFGSIFWEHFT